jgi:hypothetical protein
VVCTGLGRSTTDTESNVLAGDGGCAATSGCDAWDSRGSCSSESTTAEAAESARFCDCDERSARADSAWSAGGRRILAGRLGARGAEDEDDWSVCEADRFGAANDFLGGPDVDEVRDLAVGCSGWTWVRFLVSFLGFRGTLGGPIRIGASGDASAMEESGAAGAGIAGSEDMRCV